LGPRAIRETLDQLDLRVTRDFRVCPVLLDRVVFRELLDPMDFREPREHLDLWAPLG
jgi:hypothetical protein